MIDGGYDSGYRACPCFWGTDPGSLIVRLAEIIPCFKGLQVLDAGCGEGKNALFLADKGAVVQAYDISQLAIQHAEELTSGIQWDNISFHARDIRRIHLGVGSFDVVIAYGLMHCLQDEGEIRSLNALLQNATKEGGYLILCAFNDRFQDLSAHPGFTPTLLPHAAYLGMFAGWEMVVQLVKFHGTFSDDASLVLTETQYFERLEFESPLDIKLRADMLGKSLLFLGYSFSDINLRLMLYKLMKLRKEHKRTDRLPTAIMAGSGFTPIQRELLERWDVLVIELDPVDRDQALDDFLGKLG